MDKPEFPHKPSTPSVRQTVGFAIARARGLPRDEHPMTPRQVVEDILERLSLPEALQRELREHHGLSEPKS